MMISEESCGGRLLARPRSNEIAGVREEWRPRSFLCSHNARPQKDGEGAVRCLLARRTRTV
jgi:hypothetical protein